MPCIIESSSPPISSSSPLMTPPSGCPLLTLPNEMIDAIHGQLEPAAAVALALTCKRLFRALPASQSASGPFTWLGPDQSSQHLQNAREEFLLALEKEFPKHWFCVQENKLVFRRSSTTAINQNPRCACNPMLEMDHALFDRPGELKLHCGDIRIAMNRHFYGAAHGLPLDYFTFKRTIKAKPRYPGCQCQTAHLPRTVSWVEQWYARVIEDEFYLHGERTFNWEGRDEQELRCLLSGQDYWICWHLQLASQKSAFDDKHDDDPRSRACNKCFTDFSTSITSRVTEDGQPFIRVVLKSYHKFGNARNAISRNRFWTSALSWREEQILTHSQRFEKRRLLRCGAGQVRRAWEDEGIAESDITEMPLEE
ncbi:hypothetical protein B0T21DRAFT_39134 [Apiosordaria backusii]|uniref:F-box domain-containing protein n=1 Tax=Apiosordaria backusii TaxID=314023 RepID=A0AA40AX80_9PEZI|nr:hypothetical protein B0T21DRAFT_39134 [Apiosordaria backusii]